MSGEIIKVNLHLEFTMGLRGCTCSLECVGKRLYLQQSSWTCFAEQAKAITEPTTIQQPGF